MCAEGWYYEDSEVDGECPNCGMPTVKGESQVGCYYAPTDCDLCGSAPCDESC